MSSIPWKRLMSQRLGESFILLPVLKRFGILGHFFFLSGTYKKKHFYEMSVFFFQPSFFWSYPKEWPINMLHWLLRKKIIHKKNAPVVVQLPSPPFVNPGSWVQKAVGFGKAGPLKRTESQVLKQMKVGNLRGKRGMVFCEGAREKFFWILWTTNSSCWCFFFVRPTLISTDFWNYDVFVCGLFDDEDDDDDDDDDKDDKDDD